MTQLDAVEKHFFAKNPLLTKKKTPGKAGARHGAAKRRNGVACCVAPPLAL
jgi:hypothetical protein